MSYISSNNNRFYVATEAAYGSVAAVAATNRIPAVKLSAKQQHAKLTRQDKTGSRTFLGNPSLLRKTTTFGLTTYMCGWGDQTSLPPHGPLFQACLGSTAAQWAGGTVSSTGAGQSVSFSAPHGLSPGQALASGNEIRFVTAVVNSHSVQVNAPFTSLPPSGASLGQTVTYCPASELNSISIFDYWTPGTSVQRVLSGAAVDQFKVKVNGDIHEFEFSGQACDVVDSASFESGAAALSSFPAEPNVSGINYSIIPGHLGQVWLGSSPYQFLTVTSAQLTFNNNLDLRANEFGSVLPRAIVPGIRSAQLDFSLYQEDDRATQALYQAARQRSPISVMLQLGQQSGQLFGAYMKSVVLEVPEFDDSDKQLQWQFGTCRAQGNLDDELYVAFA